MLLESKGYSVFTYVEETKMDGEVRKKDEQLSPKKIRICNT